MIKRNRTKIESTQKATCLDISPMCMGKKSKNKKLKTQKVLGCVKRLHKQSYFVNLFFCNLTD